MNHLKNTIKSISIITTVVSLVFISFSPLTVIANDTQAIVKIDLIDYKLDIAEKINKLRETNGSNSVEMNDRLMKAAQLKAEHMAQNSYFAHTSPDGTSPWHWFYKANYKPKYAGENLALSYSLKSNIVRSWENSPSHNANLKNPRFSETGIGVAEGYYNGKKAYYIVQLFGQP